MKRLIKAPYLTNLLLLAIVWELLLIATFNVLREDKKEGGAAEKDTD